MGLDQRYEQLNKDVKGNGRMIGQQRMMIKWSRERSVAQKYW